MLNHWSSELFVKYIRNIFQETMNDALTDLVRDLNKFRGQVRKENLHYNFKVYQKLIYKQIQWRVKKASV